LRRFEALARTPRDVTGLAEAVALYRGELLFGYYDDWILLERERLRKMYVACLRHLVTAYKETGAWQDAVDAATRLVQADPLQESATRELMRLYYRTGRRDLALQQFATFKADLMAELEVEPEGETVALFQMMQAGMALANWDDSPVAGSAAAALASVGGIGPPRSPALGGHAHRLPVVGRESEQARLAAWLADPSPQPPMLLLEGEAGVGKTRLAYDTAEEAYRYRMFVLWGHYHQLAAPLPYAGLVEALRVGLRLGGPPALEPIWLSEVSRLIPELAEGRPDLPPPVTLPPDQERIRLWEGLTRYLLALSAGGPHMFVLEDIQWVDPATLDLFQYALPRLRSAMAGLRLLATARSEDLANAPGVQAALRNLEAQGILGYVPVDRLSREATGRLVQEALGLDYPAPRFSAHLWEETEGNPFFALETMRFWAERGVLSRDQKGEWHTPRSNDYSALPTPASVRRVLEQRLSRLTPAARTLIEVGSVIGRDVSESLLWRASGSTPESVLGPAEELLRHQLWLEHPSAGGYQFAHQKVLEVAYAGVSGPRRRHLHRLAAGALESEQPAAIERLAHHWLAAQDGARALPYLQEAAERAVAAFANEEALAFYGQALTASAQAAAAGAGEVDRDRVYTLLANRAALLRRVDRMAEAAADLDQLLTLARESGQPARVADALGRRAAHFISQSRYKEALADLHAALDLAVAQQNTAATARILTQLTRIHIRLGEHERAVSAAEHALACFRECGDVRGEVEALSLLGPIHGEQGDVALAIRLLEEARAKIQGIPNALHLEARVLNNLSLFLSAPQQSYDLFQRFLAIAEETGSLPLQETAHQNLGEFLCRFGALTQARPHLERARELATAAGNQHDVATLLMTRGQLRAALGEHGAALADLREALATLERLEARLGVAQAQLALGDYLLDQGSFEAGLGYIERSYALWGELGQPYGARQGALYQAQLGRAYMGLRRAGAARKAVASALASLSEPVIGGAWSDPIVEALAHCYSVLAAAGRAEEADAALRQGYERMMDLAGQCGPELRAAYLQNVRECRLLRAAWQRRPGGRPAVAANGTDDLGAERKVNERRAEILLIAADVARRGDAVDEAGLARSFGVSLRTIQRDMAALRRAGRLA
jgi:predicted ATPase/DNA-binding SARP family transcriptional activator